MPIPKVVIIGGGGGGAHLARALSQLSSKEDFELIVIDPKEYHDHAPANVRAVVDPAWADFSAIPYDKLFAPFVQHIKGHAVRYDYKNQRVRVRLLTGRNLALEYDVLVHASGFAYDVVKASKPLKTRLAEFEAVASMIESAVEVAVVGAGVTGVEIAGEIYGKYGAAKGIHLVCAGTEILPGAKPKLRHKMVKQLSDAKVIVTYNERGVNKAHGFATEGPLRLESGKVLDVDIVIWATGGELGSRQTFKVDEQLRVNESVFAIGDATDVDEPRTLYVATRHADFVAKAIEADLKGKTFKKTYKPLAHGTYFVAFGPTGGALSLPFATFGAGMARRAKSKDLLLGKFYPKSLKAKLKLLPKYEPPPKHAKKKPRAPKSLDSTESGDDSDESSSDASSSDEDSDDDSSDDDESLDDDSDDSSSSSDASSS